MKKAIKRGAVLVDGNVARTGHWVQPGQRIEVIDVESKVPKAFDLKLEVLFEDDYFAVINKPPGIVVSGNQYRTIYNALGPNLKPTSRVDALKWPKPVHRLDQPTSGLLLVAKTASALMNLGKQFEERVIQKRYQAIVIGQVLEKERIVESLDGQEAITSVLRKREVRSIKNEWLSLVDLIPETGRTHQLRKHLSGRGTPILGDKLYGKKDLVLKGKGLFLSALSLKFRHPIHGHFLEVKIERPAKFNSLLTREARRWAKYNSD